MLEQSQRALLGFQAAKEKVKNVSFTNYKGGQGMIFSELVILFCLKS